MYLHYAYYNLIIFCSDGLEKEITLRRLLFVLMLLPALLFAGDEAITDYHNTSLFLPQTPSVTGGATAAFFNPAGWSTNDVNNTSFYWTDRRIKHGGMENWGFSTGRGLGFSVMNQTLAQGTIRDYQLGFSGGDRESHFGMAYRWGGGDTNILPREKSIVAGIIKRPAPWISYGLSGVESLESGGRLGIADFGIRPFGSDMFTVFADYSMHGKDQLEDGYWGAGFEFRPISGIHIGAKMRESEFDDYTFSLNVGFTFKGGAGHHALPSYNKDGDQLGTAFLVTGDSPVAPVADWDHFEFGKKDRVIAYNLENKYLTYSKYQWGDSKHIAWLDLVKELDIIRDSDDIKAIALNLSYFGGKPSLIWEFREKLLELRENDKEVYIFIDRAGMGSYYLVSAASEIYMDKWGGFDLSGVGVSKTYLREMLDKFGIGFRAMQFFPHKTAVESFDRTDMSDGDKEQLGRLVDVIYEEFRDGAASRDQITNDSFDNVVDELVSLTAPEAVELGLADKLGRWYDLKKFLTKEKNLLWSSLNSIDKKEFHDETWGKPGTVAVVYAVGGCSMDTGIKGRSTSAYMRKLADNPDVKAVVLRADSPGGDPLPSDLVAEAIKLIQDEGKPVIISQGDLAASGGYWISMYGDEIITTPLTITGSIGVISAWVWDKEMHEKVGLNVDGVERGKHYSMNQSYRYPFVGFKLPARDLTDEEFALQKEDILDMYDGFVEAVAEGRNMSTDDIYPIAGGRIWMGADAVENGLADSIGGLQSAINRAADLAGIGDRFQLTEYPPRPLFEMPSLGTPFGMLGSINISPALYISDYSGNRADPAIEWLEIMAESQGSGQLMMMPVTLPDGWMFSE